MIREWEVDRRLWEVRRRLSVAAPQRRGVKAAWLAVQPPSSQSGAPEADTHTLTSSGSWIQCISKSPDHRQIYSLYWPQPTQTPHSCCACQTFAPIIMNILYEVSSIMKEIEKKDCSTILEGSRQIGLQYAHESYIHNIICGQVVVNKANIKIGGKAPRSQHNTSIRRPDNSREG